MSNHKNLYFFNKEGDYLNFNYNEVEERFEGDILFHENSNDTYKTVGLYTLEHIPSFDFELPGQLTTNKFQLFNEYGFHFYGSKWATQSIATIEPVNNDPTFYTKWIYGDNFEAKFPIGTFIRFNQPFTEFTNPNQVYTVVGAKPGAIMILSQMDNATFETTYQAIYSGLLSTQAPNLTPLYSISGVNAFGVYDYAVDFNNKLASWNEPDFHQKYYVGKKLNVVGSEKNDEILVVKNPNLSDAAHFEYILNKSAFPQNSDLIIEVITKTDVPLVYSGEMEIQSGGIIKIIDNFNYPQSMKPGKEFKIIGSFNNNNFYTVAGMPEFDKITQATYFDLQSQVIYNNRIYQCIQAYTQSFGLSEATNFVNPENTTYWSNPDYVKVEQPTFLENLLDAQLYFTTDRFYYTYGFTVSNEVTLASAAQKFKTDLELFNVDLFYENNKLRADLKYASLYTQVNFYHTQLGSTFSVGQTRQTIERLVEVEEVLDYELNYNFSQNFRYNVVFIDIDEAGIKILINGMVYDEEVAFVFSGSTIDMERTIDRTLRSWLRRWSFRLLSLGIIVDLQYTGNSTSIFYNSILIKSQYPNVPITIEEVEVGTTAFYYIEHSKILFTNLGPYLTININDEDYGIQTIFATNSVPNISATLEAWIDEHAETLLEFGVLAGAYNTILRLDLLDADFRLDYTINTGKLNIPGIVDYKITKRLLGNEGVLVASNEVVIPQSSTVSFEQEGFATGMAFSINNTFYPWLNQDYVIQNLEPTSMNLSYQGPFWGLTGPECNTGAFAILGFNNGFGQTACTIIVPPTGGTGGPFDPNMFDPNMFSLTVFPNVYSVNTFNFSSNPGSGNFVDIEYIQLSNSIYCFGDGVVVIDAFLGEYITSVLLPGNTQSIEMKFNPINSYLYCLSESYLWVVDPTSNLLVTGITFSNIAQEIEINPINGDVYLTFKNNGTPRYWTSDNLTNNPSGVVPNGGFDCSGGAMVFNDFEEDMYITSFAGTGHVIRINGVNRSFSTAYGIPGATNSIFYEPVQEAIYVYGSGTLWEIDNGVAQSITNVSTYGFRDIIFNNISGLMNISDSSFNYYDLNLSDTTADSTLLSNYGYLVVNQFDGDVYMSSQAFNTIVILDSQTKQVLNTQPLPAGTGRIIYNPERKTVWSIQPTLNSVVEISVELNNQINPLPLTFSNIDDNVYGTLDPNYEPRESIWLKTRDYFRRPRENFEGDVSVKYYWKWLSDEVPEFFMYDFSGEQLSKTGAYAYTGENPLKNAVLNRNPNKDITKVSYSAYQQTIFDKVEYTLSYVDDEDDVSSAPQALELFLGFKADNEGALRSVLQLYKKEEIEFDIVSDSLTNITFETIDIENVTDKRGRIFINETSSVNFTGRGLKSGQHLVIYVKDTSNVRNQYISDNNAIIVKIREVYTKILIVDFFNIDVDILENENTVLTDYPQYSKTTYLKTSFRVRDREIGRFITWGQTEEEDIRFKTELGNIGKLINPDEVFIFKEYDINEGGIDWMYLNKKRKEMLMVRNVIYPYIGSYKSLINAINYFGYNDLQLNEYYRNKDVNSKEFGKLFKVEIPDIFDNTIKGWNEQDFLIKYLPSDNYEETNMFNLTYFITDKQGNYILNYSLDEIIIKLQGLKYWIKRNIIPLTHKILDITGRAFFTGGNQITHQTYDMRIIKIRDEMSPVTFKMNEAYLHPVNSGSTVYNCVLDFYNILPGTNQVNEFLPNPKPYYNSKVSVPDLYDIKIRTYKIYKEWAPYVTYNKGDKVSYFDKIYESQIDNNRIKNPRRFEGVSTWDELSIYEVTSTVEWERDYYVYSSLGDPNFTVSPNLDSTNWLKITEWKQIDLEPVQTLTETRPGEELTPYNFTVDSNIDPFLVIEVSSHNGYGSVYRDKKNYYLKGTKDLQEPYRYIDPIGPFVPITPVYT
jgi:hypothetical protein